MPSPGDGRGVALPSLVAVVSVVVVVAAAAAFVLSSGGAEPVDAAGPGTASEATTATSPSHSPRPTTAGQSPSSRPDGKHKSSTPSPSSHSSASGSASASPSPSPSPVERSAIYVEVYNNSHVGGLAGRTAEELKQTGWQVVGADNWYGTIPSSTVYYPERLHDAAKQLAQDLGIERVHPAVEPMKFDRLTVILTADYA